MRFSPGINKMVKKWGWGWTRHFCPNTFPSLAAPLPSPPPWAALRLCLLFCQVCPGWQLRSHTWAGACLCSVPGGAVGSRGKGLGGTCVHTDIINQASLVKSQLARISLVTVQQLQRFIPEWQKNPRHNSCNAFPDRFSPLGCSHMGGIALWNWLFRHRALRRGVWTQSYVMGQVIWRHKTEQYQGTNLKSSSKIPGDSAIFYKTIYTSLFWSWQGLLAQTAQSQSILSILITPLIYIFLYIFIYLLIFISSTKGEIKISIYKISWW